MKKLLIIFLILLSFDIKSQNFPRYFIQDNDTIGVIYSISQAQKIYNDQILLDLFKDMRVSCDTLAKKYFILVNRYDQKQVINKNLINQLEQNEKENKLIIAKKDEKINLLESDAKKSDDQKKLKDDQLKDYEQIVKELKTHRSWLLGSTIGFGALSLFFAGAVLMN